MHQITFMIEGGEDATIFAATGENLLALARKANVAIDAPCSGNGSCGKCRVRLISGEVNSAESRHISDAEFIDGWRLACAATVAGEATLHIPDIASAYKSRMKVADLSSPGEIAIFDNLLQSIEAAGLERDSGVKSFTLTLDAPTLDETMPDNERVTRAANAALPFSVLRDMPDMLRDNGFNVRCVMRGTEILDLLPSGDTSPICGLAIDIGTTTVSGLLVDLETGAILAKASAGNGQIRYGADVINRIIEQQKPDGVRRLQDAIVAETLLPLIDIMCRDAGVPRSRVYEMTVASNSTMNHLLLGINANYLRTEPYIPAFFELPPLNPSDIGIALAPTARLRVAPNIGSYVGGDITAGTLACMMWSSDEMSILIDLGTNGEIVFGNGEFLMACACSAGPAFEGGDISIGMRATDGAIEACTIDGGTMEPELVIIGGGKPVGLCGSGLIDVIAELFRTGMINGKGKFTREGARILHDEYGSSRYVLAYAGDSATGRDIAITEVDIDNFIRAKGAIFSAVMSLITPLGFTPEDISGVMVAGGIGSGINIANAIRIGMLPDLPVERYSYIGNSALTGAYAALISRAAADKTAELARSMTYLELSTQPGYMDEFIAACFLPHTDESLFPSAQ